MENKDQHHQQAAESKYECLLFDLDDTLYPMGSGISAQVTKNIQEYMLEKLGIEESKVPELCFSLYKNYGTTMAGLKAIGYDFEYDDFHSFVHGRLPYERLKPDPTLRGLLHSLPIRKVVFTNGDEAHAARVLKRLGIEDCFQMTISFETLNPNHNKITEPGLKESNGIVDVDKYLHQDNSGQSVPKTPVVGKPFEEAYEKVFEMANISPQQTVFFDDSFRNLHTGKKLGLTSVLVGSSHRVSGIDHVLESIHNIREALPELWEAEEETSSVVYSDKIAIETFVQA